MTLKTRLTQAERTLGTDPNASTYCQCGPDRVEVVWNEITPFMGKHPDPKPEICPQCGKPVRVIDVTWDEIDDWRGGMPKDD